MLLQIIQEVKKQGCSLKRCIAAPPIYNLTFHSQSWKYQHQQQTWDTALNNPRLCQLLKCSLPRALIPSRSVQMLSVCLCLLPSRSPLTSPGFFAGSVSISVTAPLRSPSSGMLPQSHCSTSSPQSSLPCDRYQGHALIPEVILHTSRHREDHTQCVIQQFNELYREFKIPQVASKLTDVVWIMGFYSGLLLLSNDASFWKLKLVLF